MKTAAIVRVLGFIVASVGAAMLPPAILAFVDRTKDLVPLLVSSAIPLVSGVAMLLAGHAHAKDPITPSLL